LGRRRKGEDVIPKLALWARALRLLSSNPANAFGANRFPRDLKAICVAAAGVVFLVFPAFADGPGQTSESSQQDWKSEIGTSDTEAALNLTPADEAEIQLRLKALGLYQGELTGKVDEPTRFAISEWQKSRGAALSSFLGPLELAELRVESEDAYLKLLAAPTAPQPTPAQAARPPAQAAKPPAQAARHAPAARPPPHVAKEPARAPVRRVARRPVEAPAPDVPAAAAPTCNANPTWCRQAGLPVSGPAPRVGRPAEFNGGN
jgi:hypothetical protein